MAYAIEHGEPISKAVPRIVMERVEAAHEQLLDRSKPVEERIHNARKRFKETRAALRLIRFSLGKQFAIENAWFRDAARDLATLRDADAVIESIGKLGEFADGFHDRRVLRKVRRPLERAQRKASREGLDARISNTAQQLPVAKARVSLWPPLDDRFDTIGDGLRRTFRDGCRAFLDARTQPSPETFHEWRKRVKDHWYHTQILRHLWPEVMKPHREQMERLSDALGERHDLDMLQQIAVENGHFQSDFDLRVLHALIDRRSAELTATATTLGERIYAERPRAVYEKFKLYWKTWAAD